MEAFAVARPGRTAPDGSGRGARRQGVLLAREGRALARLAYPGELGGAPRARGAGSPARSPSRRTRKRAGADVGTKAGASTLSTPPPTPSATSLSAPSRPTGNGGHWLLATDELAIEAPSSTPSLPGSLKGHALAGRVGPISFSRVGTCCPWPNFNGDGVAASSSCGTAVPRRQVAFDRKMLSAGGIDRHHNQRFRVDDECDGESGTESKNA